MSCKGERTLRSAEILVIGIGNRYRQDDGAGCVAARQLRRRGVESVAVEGRDGLALFELWKGRARVFILDAVRSGAEAGTFHHFDARNLPLPAIFSAPASTHAFGLAEAIELARELKQLPAALIVYGIEGKNFGSGVGLSPEVRGALPQWVEKIMADI